MTDRPMARFDDAALEGALRSLASAIDWPAVAPAGPSGAAGPDIATRVRVGLTDPSRRRTTRPWWRAGRPAGRPLRRSVVLALVALLALAVVAGAVGLGLPGLRFILGGGPTPPPTTPIVQPDGSPTSSPTVPGSPGAGMGLGEPVTLDQVEAKTGIPVRLPSDRRFGEPDTVWVDVSKANQVAYVWASSADFPETNERGVGFVLMRFDGVTDPGFYQKLIGSGTHIQKVDVDGHDGFWIEGDPHFFYYVRGTDVFVEENRRWVGDALVWSDGSTTFRIESGLGRDATIAIAASVE
jgi:hypothetical protein